MHLSTQEDKSDFTIKDQGCACDGLQTVLKMAELYRDYADGVKHIPRTPQTNRLAYAVTKSILLRVKPEDAFGERGKFWIQEAQRELTICEASDFQQGCMMALEDVRAAIHDDMGVDAKLTCQKFRPGLGSDFVEAQPWNDIRWSMYGLAHFGLNDEKTAVKVLKVSLEKHGCPVDV